MRTSKIASRSLGNVPWAAAPLVGALSVLGLTAIGCGPTQFKGPSGPDPSNGAPKQAGVAATVNPVEMPFAVHTRSRNGITRLHAQLGEGDFVSSGVMVAATNDLNKPLAKIEDAKEIFAVGGTPDDFYTFSATLIGNSVRRVKGGVVGPSFRATGAESYTAVGVSEEGAYVLIGNKSAPQPYAKARVDFVSDTMKPSGLSIAPQYCWDAIKARRGEVILAGRACREGDGRLVVERFTAGAKVGTLDKLPGELPREVRFKDVHLHAQRTGIFVTATMVLPSGEKPYAAKWNGKEWAEVPVPAQFNEILSFSEGVDGSLFVVETQVAARTAQVWRRDTGGSWRPVPLPKLREEEHLVYSKVVGKYTLQKPPQFVPLTVSARTQDEVWVAASIEDGDDLIHSLLHKTQVPSFVEWPDIPRPAPPPVAECKGSFFLALGPIPQGHGSYQEVRRLLAGHHEVEGLTLLETVQGGRRVYGVYHTSRESVTRVQELLGKGGVKGEVRCETPAATRVVTFKISTGELGVEEAPENPNGGQEHQED